MSRPKMNPSMKKVNVTITLTPTVIAKAKDKCFQDGKSLSAKIDEMLAAYVSDELKTPKRKGSAQGSGNRKEPAMKDTIDNSERLPASDGFASVVRQFVECPSCGKLWPYDGHAADVCCGGCSYNFYVPPCATTRMILSER